MFASPGIILPSCADCLVYDRRGLACQASWHHLRALGPPLSLSHAAHLQLSRFIARSRTVRPSSQRRTIPNPTSPISCGWRAPLRVRLITGLSCRCLAADSQRPSHANRCQDSLRDVVLANKVRILRRGLCFAPAAGDPGRWPHWVECQSSRYTGEIGWRAFRGALLRGTSKDLRQPGT